MLKPVSPCIHSLFHGNSFSVVQLIIISPLIFVNNLDSPSWKFPWSSVYCFFTSIEEGCLQIHQNFSSQLRRLDKIICAGFGSEVRRSLGLSHGHRVDVSGFIVGLVWGAEAAVGKCQSRIHCEHNQSIGVRKSRKLQSRFLAKRSTGSRIGRNLRIIKSSNGIKLNDQRFLQRNWSQT